MTAATRDLMKLVCLVGIDGTGKTTMARNLARALEERGLSATCVYGRINPVLSRVLMGLGRMTALHGSNQWANYQAYNLRKKRLMRSRLLARIYTAATLFDYYPQIWLKLAPHLLADRIVVCDRYIYDTVISDLAVHLSYSPEDTRRAIDRGLRALPNPALAAVLDAPPDVAFSRKSDVPHVDYLTERRAWYLTLGSRPEVKMFDASAPPSEVLENLLEEVLSR